MPRGNCSSTGNPSIVTPVKHHQVYRRAAFHPHHRQDLLGTAAGKTPGCARVVSEVETLPKMLTPAERLGDCHVGVHPGGRRAHGGEQIGQPAAAAKLPLAGHAQGAVPRPSGSRAPTRSKAVPSGNTHDRLTASTRARTLEMSAVALPISRQSSRGNLRVVRSRVSAPELHQDRQGRRPLALVANAPGQQLAGDRRGRSAAVPTVRPAACPAGDRGCGWGAPAGSPGVSPVHLDAESAAWAPAPPIRPVCPRPLAPSAAPGR